jgi:ADP-ribose pyrophosphatase YjhB (NUDIX family)
MSDLLHRIKIFVFQQRGPEPQYLLLRGAQRMESFWGPLHGNIGFGEKLETAIRREVLDETGVLKPLDVIDLQMPVHQSLGDEDIIEWTYGFKTIPPERPLRLDPRWSEFRWVEFSRAYPLLELDLDRAAFMRLHSLLRAA